MDYRAPRAGSAVAAALLACLAAAVAPVEAGAAESADGSAKTAEEPDTRSDSRRRVEDATKEWVEQIQADERRRKAETQR